MTIPLRWVAGPWLWERARSKPALSVACALYLLPLLLLVATDPVIGHVAFQFIIFGSGVLGMVASHRANSAESASKKRLWTGLATGLSVVVAVSAPTVYLFGRAAAAAELERQRPTFDVVANYVEPGMIVLKLNAKSPGPMIERVHLEIQIDHSPITSPHLLRIGTTR